MMELTASIGADNSGIASLLLVQPALQHYRVMAQLDSNTKQSVTADADIPVVPKGTL